MLGDWLLCVCVCVNAKEHVHVHQKMGRRGETAYAQASTQWGLVTWQCFYLPVLHPVMIPRHSHVCPAFLACFQATGAETQTLVCHVGSDFLCIVLNHCTIGLAQTNFLKSPHVYGSLLTEMLTWYMTELNQSLA